MTCTTRIALFAEDGIWESASFGTATGHAEIRALFEGFQATFSFSQHNIMNPRITINGERAQAVWYIMGPWNDVKAGRNIWMTARYDDDYVKIDGEWKYQHLRADVRMVEDRPA